MNSRDKGKVGEREFRDVLRSAGYSSARRGQQFSGSNESPDVVCEELPGIHWEIKRVERLNVHDAIAQAVRDCGDAMPVVAHRRNRTQWLVTMRAEDFLTLARQSRRGDE